MYEETLAIYRLVDSVYHARLAVLLLHSFIMLVCSTWISVVTCSPRIARWFGLITELLRWVYDRLSMPGSQATLSTGPGCSFGSIVV